MEAKDIFNLDKKINIVTTYFYKRNKMIFKWQYLCTIAQNSGDITKIILIFFSGKFVINLLCYLSTYLCKYLEYIKKNLF